MAGRRIDEARRALQQAAEDGDAVAQAALHDLEEEAGVPRCQPLKIGDWVYIYTAAHAHVGPIVGIDHEEIVLNSPEGVTWVFETGPLQEFVLRGVAAYCELYPGEVRCRRGAIITVCRYPLGRHPAQKRA